MIAPGPITYSGVGNQKGVCDYGAFSVRLPLKNGGIATLSGMFDKMTTDFPKYPLMKISKDIKEICLSKGKMGLYKKLPNLPKKVGGQTDILIGLKYKKYFPQQVLMFPTGLTVYRSVFEGLDGTDGVLGGPHPEITKMNNRQVGGDRTGHFCYFATSFDEYRKKSLVACNIPLFGSDKVDKSCDLHLALCKFDSGNGTFLSRKKPLKCIKMFDEAENAGTEISYRCVNCRNCPKCKKCPRLDAVTIQEEVEQGIIDCSVQVDVVRRVTTAALPFVTNPDLRLEPNESLALNVYKLQTKKLSSRLEDKLAVQQSEYKLQQLKFVDYLDNVSEDEKKLIEGKLQNFIPWRAVWSEKSLSTPCRLVFDASQTTSTGIRLNNLLAKGVNRMNKLVEILIRWTTHSCAFHTDIQKMYNAVLLQPSHWRYQMYLWRDDLDVERPPHQNIDIWGKV